MMRMLCYLLAAGIGLVPVAHAAETFDPLALAKEIAIKEIPTAMCVYLSGSFARDEQKAHSDMDIIVLADPLPGTDGPMVRLVDRYDDVPYEIFAYTPASMQFELMRAKASGQGTFLPMLAYAKTIVDTLPLCKTMQEQAKKIDAEGANAPTAELVDLMRYGITSLAEDLADPRPPEQVFAIVAALHQDVSAFYLRVNKRWSGHNKHTPRQLAAVDAAYAKKFDAAFLAYRQTGEVSQILGLVADTLAPYGGLVTQRFEYKPAAKTIGMPQAAVPAKAP